MEMEGGIRKGTGWVGWIFGINLALPATPPVAFRWECKVSIAKHGDLGRTFDPQCADPGTRNPEPEPHQKSGRSIAGVPNQQTPELYKLEKLAAGQVWHICHMEFRVLSCELWVSSATCTPSPKSKYYQPIPFRKSFFKIQSQCV